MQILVSPSKDPYFNLALEKYLLFGCEGDFLLLYINNPSVIVGRNQSEEAEADMVFCRLHGIPVIKRMSGGGTVYHDEGNVNYAFITSVGGMPILDEDVTKPVTDALASMGVEAKAGVRREILVGRRKISGTASCSAKGRQIFHGTLLHRTDLDMLEKTLRGDQSKRGRKVASVPSEVINLSEFPALDIPTGEFVGRLADFFLDYYGQEALYELTATDIEEIDKLANE